MRYRTLILLGMINVLGACASLIDDRPPEEIVAERASEHLNLLHKQDWEAALQFTTPSFRKNNTPEQYAKRYGGVWMWRGTRVGKVACDAAAEITRCVADTYRTVQMPPMTWESEHYKPRVWIKVDRDWYIFERG